MKLKQTDLWESKEAWAIRFEGGFKCAKCGGYYILGEIILDSFPYNHADVKTFCLCGESDLLGIPIDKTAGIGLNIFDTKPLKRLLEVRRELETLKPYPRCKWHKKKMKLTKIFGDMVYKDVEKTKTYRIQLKCPYCYVTMHFVVTP